MLRSQTNCQRPHIVSRRINGSWRYERPLFVTESTKTIVEGIHRHPNCFDLLLYSSSNNLSLHSWWPWTSLHGLWYTSPYSGKRFSAPDWGGKFRGWQKKRTIVSKMCMKEHFKIFLCWLNIIKNHWVLNGYEMSVLTMITDTPSSAKIRLIPFMRSLLQKKRIFCEYFHSL